MELLIAFTIFSIIAASIYYTLSAGIRVYRRGNVMIKDNQNLRIFFDALSKDLRNALPYNIDPDAEKKSEFRTIEDTNFQIEPEWLLDKVSFASLINVFTESGMRPELTRVSYYLDDKKIMRRYSGKAEGFGEESAEAEELLGELEDFEVEELSFEYSYSLPGIGFDEEFEWRDEEFEDGLPQGVKAILTLKNKARKSEEIFAKTVFIPRGKLGGEEKK